MSTYKLIDGTSGVSTEIEAATDAEARAQAEAWMRDCEWGNEETIWPRVMIVRPGIPDDPETERWEAEDLTVTIDPPEPPCSSPSGKHDWRSPFEIVGGIRENPGVWGHGGGITLDQCCMRCGCGKVTDTWAQNRDTGEQGLESVRYEPEKYAAKLRK